jgi:hypothetical protein
VIIIQIREMQGETPDRALKLVDLPPGALAMPHYVHDIGEGFGCHICIDSHPFTFYPHAFSAAEELEHFGMRNGHAYSFQELKRRGVDPFDLMPFHAAG